MKQLLKRGLLLLALAIGIGFHGAAQSIQMHVVMNDETVQTYAIGESDRIYFEDNTYLVFDMPATNNLIRIRMEDIRKITCEETVGLSESQASEVSIMPNPVHDVMILRNLDGLQNVSIYAIDGRLMKSFEVKGDEVIDISDLSIGLYLVKTQSCTLKMIKL
jgi:hypothetical protein